MIGKEVINLRSLGRRESGQNIFHIFKRIDAQALASFDNAHDRGGGITTFFGTGKEPIASAEHHWLNATFTSIIANFYKRVVQVDQKSSPAIERVRDGFSQFCFWQLSNFCFFKESVAATTY